MHLVNHISESISRMGPGDNITTDISERLYIANVKKAYRSSNKVKYIRQMLKHNDRCSSLDYMEEILSYHALEGWYIIDSAQVFILLSATNKRRHRQKCKSTIDCAKRTCAHAQLIASFPWTPAQRAAYSHL
jgi:hypothetical protein